MQCKHLRRGCGGFIGSKMKRNKYRKPERNEGTKSSRKKNQNREEGRRIFSESVEENPTEEDPILNRPVCIHSISPVASRLHLHPHKRDRLCLPQMSDESFYGLIAADETVITNQVLVNPLGTQPHTNRRFNLGRMRLAKTLTTRCGPGGRNGWF